MGTHGDGECGGEGRGGDGEDRCERFACGAAGCGGRTGRAAVLGGLQDRQGPLPRGGSHADSAVTDCSHEGPSWPGAASRWPRAGRAGLAVAVFQAQRGEQAPSAGLLTVGRGLFRGRCVVAF